MNVSISVFVRRFALMITACIVAIFVAEGLLRATGAAPDRGGVFTVSADRFEEIPGIFSPNQRGVVNQIPALRYEVSTDSLGYRGQDFPRSSPEGEFRILVVGDSFVFGDFVGDGETLPAQLERALASRCNAPVRVVNAGLGGSTITEHREMIERGLVLEPDLIVLQFSENDVFDLAGTAMWEELAQNRATKGRFPLSVAYPHIRSTALWNLALRAAALVRDRRDAGSSETAAPDQVDGAGSNESTAREAADPNRDLYRAHLADLQAMLASRGTPLLMTVMPSHLSVYDHWESDQLDWLDGLLNELHMPTVRFFPLFKADGRGETELYLLPYDGHASPEAYRIAAQELSEVLVAREPGSSYCSRGALPG